MTSLFEMMANAQNGNGIEALARQFGLSQEQTMTALQALLPAFSQGLKRNAADPYGLGAMMSAMAGGQHAPFFDNAAAAASPTGIDQGNAVLGQLFGSKDLSRAVAAQAAQATGIGQALLAQMLPVIAAMLMGGLSKQATGQAGAPQAGSGNVFADMLQQMMRQGGMMGMPGNQTQQSSSQSGVNPSGDNPFAKMLQDMFGGAAGTTPSPQPAANPFGGDNPLGRMFEQMMGGGQEKTNAPAPPPEEPQAGPSDRPRNPYDEMFGRMFDAGTTMRDEYQKNMDSIFDQYLKGMDRHG